MATGWQEAVVREVTLQDDPPLVVHQKTIAEEILYRAIMPEFIACNLQNLYCVVYPESIKRGKVRPARVNIAVWPTTDPQKPGRYLTEKPAKIQVKIERPRTRFTLVARLGVIENMDDFRNEQSFSLPDYRAGEEQNWKLTVSFQLFK